ncbi:MAG: selenocysteine-specific translation elongation factor [bacterium TMED217]|nr:MAG: selenocysteine-specific translation elongation factor [bacterium TMED217]|tara:strand:- start:7621 stop:9483 length:1863 start_codon:yes stop_codon:yes gene_type:complete
MQQVVIGTAGHIDHGKTSLVKALTGTNTDTLSQEKQRGITIDLGFAYLNDDITIVDVPGHQKFIRNMVAGASTIHIGLLVIAADDGIMPQTIEHLHILNSLSIDSGITVLTKMDLVDDEWSDLVETEIIEIQKRTLFENRPILKVDSLSKKGISNLKQAIISLAKTIKFTKKTEYFKMHVDRVFSKKGYGPVVTGTVKSGKIAVGNKIEILPGKIISQVRGIQTHGGNLQEVKSGDRAALNLTKIDIKVLNRGATISNPGLISITDKLLANLSMSPYTSWSLKNNQRVRIHIGTAEILARIRFNKKILDKNKTSNVIIIFERPIGVTINDLFVVRSYSPMDTIASGVVLDIDYLDNKEYISKCPKENSERIKFMISNFSHNPKTVKEWSKRYFISDNELNKNLRLLNAKVTKDEGLVYFENDLLLLKKKIMSYIKEKCSIDSFHNYVEVNNIVQSFGLSDKWVNFIVGILAKSDDIKLKSGKITLVNQSLNISNKIKLDLENIIGMIKNSDSEIISIKNIISLSSMNPKKVKELIYLLNSQSKIIQINDNMVMNDDAFNRLLTLIQKHFEKNKTLSISEFKNLSNLTRKNAIPILEFFDNSNITNREGNNRVAGESLFVK